jgi:hypothetical protein
MDGVVVIAIVVGGDGDGDLIGVSSLHRPRAQ